MNQDPNKASVTSVTVFGYVTRGPRGQPLAVLEGHPFAGARYTSAQLKQMALYFQTLATLTNLHTGKADVMFVVGVKPELPAGLYGAAA